MSVSFHMEKEEQTIASEPPALQVSVLCSCMTMPTCALSENASPKTVLASSLGHPKVKRRNFKGINIFLLRPPMLQ